MLQAQLNPAPKVRKIQIKCEFAGSRPPYTIENIRALVYSLTENDNDFGRLV
jgi:hypothetical protein